ncbi:MAG: META domain-containing protein [Pseudomonadota bacterium]
MVLRGFCAFLALFPLVSPINAGEPGKTTFLVARITEPLPRSRQNDSHSRPLSRQNLADTQSLTNSILGLDELGSSTITPRARVTAELNPPHSVDADESGTPALQGLVTFVAGGAEYTDCISGTTYPVLTDGDFPALEHAYLAAGQEPGDSILATFEGEIQMSATGTNEDDGVVVDRFLGVWPGISCERALGDVGLTNTFWKITSLFETTVIATGEGREPHMILLEEDSRFTATVGCNQLVGSFELSGQTIDFGPGASSTQMACVAEQAKWESLLLEMIVEANGWRITNGELNLLDVTGSNIAVFESVPLN